MSGPVVAVDARRSFASGIGRYTSGLLSALRELDTAGQLELVELAQRPTSERSSRWVEFDEPLLTAWDASRLTNILSAVGADVLIAPQYYISPYLDIPCIRVLHDAHPFSAGYVAPRASVFELIYGRPNLEALADQSGHCWSPTEAKDDRSVADLICAMYRRVTEMSDALATVSYFSAGDLTHYLPDTVGRWTVLYPYVDHDLMTAAEWPDSTAPDLNALLLVSKFEPRKQQLESIEAIARLRASSGEDIHLTLVGGPTASFPEYGDLVRARGAEGSPWVTIRSNVPDAELSALYAGSVLTLFPSMSEGFGYPALESLSHGTAVLASSGSALPEVCGGVAYYFDENGPLDAAIRGALDRARAEKGAGSARRAQAARFDRASYRDAIAAIIGSLL
ncbi:MAG: glycosyltransferase [Dermatophilaceae bacterium]